MPETRATSVPPSAILDDIEIARRVAAGETALFEILMRRHNQRIYRTVRSILRDEAECEEAMQMTWIAAWRALGRFEGRSSLLTWLTSIAIREARRKGARLRRVVDRSEELSSGIDDGGRGPEEEAMQSELGAAIGREIDQLPEIYRTVVILREVEELTTSETAAALEITEDTVKQRLRRARALLRSGLERRASGEIRAVFPFHDPRCDRIVAAVLEQIARESR